MEPLRDERYVGEDFGGGDWRERELVRCTFERCRFTSSSLEEMITTGCRFIECEFTGAMLNASLHTETAFLNCRFEEASLFVAKFMNCKLTGSDFTKTRLDGITIVQGDWSYTNLKHAHLAKQDLRGVLFMEADLHGANLEKADLRKCDLTRAQLSQAKLTGADLRGAETAGVDWLTVNVKGARMDGAQAVGFLRSYGAKVD
ncbi:pentapeptide repeat-containing protein [Paenibacillus xylaniclasticus]|uniref:pentapeptide repeat-containing protein n=1 Tax=Paenibacillus xylaniclasticus TaxID=588083 RepID=UPI000FD8C517|nr:MULTISPECIES: pentapeptide repeat-containing protein [Paenibacillus]GFN32886.1 hypothetical protein PCURB6_31460 [Paenibacillus curdlanolyticus]